MGLEIDDILRFTRDLERRVKSLERVNNEKRSDADEWEIVVPGGGGVDVGSTVMHFFGWVDAEASSL